jgi:hypothetical protein
MSKAATARVKEMEQQLEQVRSTSRKKLQDLELKLKVGSQLLLAVEQQFAVGRGGYISAWIFLQPRGLAV